MGKGQVIIGGGGSPVEVSNLPLEPDGNSVSTTLVDQTTPPLDAFFLQSLSAFTLGLDTTASGETTLVFSFTALSGHGIQLGDEIILLDTIESRSFFAIVQGVSGDTITVDRPLDHVFPAVTALGRIVNSNMAVDGSTTPQFFSLRAGDIPFDVTRFIFQMVCSDVPDDSKFGDITGGITNGIVFRIFQSSYQKTVFNFKTNGEISNMCFDFRYNDRAGPQGERGVAARLTWAGPSKHGVTIRLDADDILQWIVRDNLSPILSFRIVPQGHEVN